MSNFQPLEVVGRGSKTQLQVGENLNKLAGKGFSGNCQDNTKHHISMTYLAGYYLD